MLYTGGLSAYTYNLYFNKEKHKGFYASSGIGYSSIEFDVPKYDFYGTYNYINFPSTKPSLN